MIRDPATVLPMLTSAEDRRAIELWARVAELERENERLRWALEQTEAGAAVLRQFVIQARHYPVRSKGVTRQVCADCDSDGLTTKAIQHTETCGTGQALAGNAGSALLARLAAAERDREAALQALNVDIDERSLDASLLKMAAENPYVMLRAHKEAVGRSTAEVIAVRRDLAAAEAERDAARAERDRAREGEQALANALAHVLNVHTEEPSCSRAVHACVTLALAGAFKETEDGAVIDAAALTAPQEADQ